MTKRTFFSLALLLLLLLAAGVALSQSGYDLRWWTADGGGGVSAGGPFAVSDTVGQPDAGEMAGGPFTLRGGFWTGAETPPEPTPEPTPGPSPTPDPDTYLYLPVALR